MKLQEIEQKALALTEPERAELVLSLMDTLGAGQTDISDDEALQRDAELENGVVTAVLQEDFVRAVQEGRQR